MLIDTKRIVPASEFRSKMPRYIEESRRVHQPIAISHNGEVVGFFVSLEEYEEILGSAVHELLSERLDDSANVSHEAAKKRMTRRLTRARKAR